MAMAHVTAHNSRQLEHDGERDLHEPSAVLFPRTETIFRDRATFAWSRSGQPTAPTRRSCVTAHRTLQLLLLAMPATISGVPVATLNKLAQGDVVITSPSHAGSYLMRVDVWPRTRRCLASAGVSSSAVRRRATDARGTCSTARARGRHTTHGSNLCPEQGASRWLCTSRPAHRGVVAAAAGFGHRCAALRPGGRKGRTL